MKKLGISFERGFTLTELMAVVIIIAILSGIAAGSYKKAVERSRFADGLAMASSVMEAVDRYFYDNPTASDSQYPKLSKLDISFANQKPCSGNTLNYCVKTKYFSTTITNSGYTEAARNNGNYKVRVYSSAFGSNTHEDPQCIYLNEGGKKMCISMGYSSCTTSPICQKP